jgi:hypothetical protein
MNGAVGSQTANIVPQCWSMQYKNIGADWAWPIKRSTIAVVTPSQKSQQIPVFLKPVFKPDIKKPDTVSSYTSILPSKWSSLELLLTTPY